jgi:hypothetical protein
MKSLLLLLAALSGPALAQSASPWDGLDFLKGTWTAKATGPDGVATSGSYTFQSELGRHAMVRYSTRDGACKAPASFDCEHADTLIVYQDAPSQPLKALYVDNEGHAIHYEVSTPSAGTAVFVSEPSAPGPRFRLAYALHGTEMTGQFQILLPGQKDWKSYLEWSGSRK